MFGSSHLASQGKNVLDPMPPHYSKAELDKRRREVSNKVSLSSMSFEMKDCIGRQDPRDGAPRRSGR